MNEELEKVQESVNEETAVQNEGMTAASVVTDETAEGFRDILIENAIPEKPKRVRKKKVAETPAEVQEESLNEMRQEEKASVQGKRVRHKSVLSIDERPSVETEEERRRAISSIF